MRKRSNNNVVDSSFGAPRSDQDSKSSSLKKMRLQEIKEYAKSKKIYLPSSITKDEMIDLINKHINFKINEEVIKNISNQTDIQQLRLILYFLNYNYTLDDNYGRKQNFALLNLIRDILEEKDNRTPTETDLLIKLQDMNVVDDIIIRVANYQILEEWFKIVDYYVLGRKMNYKYITYIKSLFPKGGFEKEIENTIQEITKYIIYKQQNVFTTFWEFFRKCFYSYFIYELILADDTQKDLREGIIKGMEYDYMLRQLNTKFYDLFNPDDTIENYKIIFEQLFLKPSDKWKTILKTIPVYNIILYQPLFNKYDYADDDYDTKTNTIKWKNLFSTPLSLRFFIKETDSNYIKYKNNYYNFCIKYSLLNCYNYYDIRKQDTINTQQLKRICQRFYKLFEYVQEFEKIKIKTNAIGNKNIIQYKIEVAKEQKRIESIQNTQKNIERLQNIQDRDVEENKIIQKQVQFLKNQLRNLDNIQKDIEKLYNYFDITTLYNNLYKQDSEKVDIINCIIQKIIQKTIINFKYEGNKTLNSVNKGFAKILDKIFRLSIQKIFYDSFDLSSTENPFGEYERFMDYIQDIHFIDSGKFYNLGHIISASELMKNTNINDEEDEEEDIKDKSGRKGYVNQYEGLSNILDEVSLSNKLHSDRSLWDFLTTLDETIIDHSFSEWEKKKLCKEDIKKAI